MKPAFCLTLAAILFIPLAASPCFGEEVERAELTEAYLKARSETLWYGLYLNKKKMGFVRWQLRPQGEGANRTWLLSTDSQMKLMAFGKETEVREVEEWTFRGEPPCRLLKATRLYTSGKRVLAKMELTLTGTSALAVIEESGVKRTMDLGSLDTALADGLAADVWIGKAPAVGDKIVYHIFSLRSLKQQVESAELLGRETVLVHGVKTTISRVRILPPEKGQQHIVRFDPLGRWLSASYPGNVESRLEPEAVARKVKVCHDLYTRGMVEVDKPLGIHPFHIKTLVFAIPARLAKVIPKAQQQSVLVEGEKTFLHLGADAGRAVKAMPDEVKECLRETVMYPISHEMVKALTREAVGDAKTDEEKAARLVKFVYQFIRKKEYRFEPHSVFEIVKIRRGDCSEHSHLFATLARCAGLPTRAVSGIVYQGDKKPSFGLHAWNEVVIKGHWVQVDPTWNQTAVDATHVLLKRGSWGLGWETLGSGTVFRVVKVVKKP